MPITLRGNRDSSHAGLLRAPARRHLQSVLPPGAALAQAAGRIQRKYEVAHVPPACVYAIKSARLRDVDLQEPGRTRRLGVGAACRGQAVLLSWSFSQRRSRRVKKLNRPRNQAAPLGRIAVAAIEDHDQPRCKSVIFSSRARVWQRSGFPGPAQARKGNQTVALDDGHREPLLTVDVV